MEKRTESVLTQWSSLSPKAKQSRLRAYSLDIKSAMNHLRADFSEQLAEAHEALKLDLAQQLIDILMGLCIILDPNKKKRGSSDDICSQVKQKVSVVQELLIRQDELLKENQKCLKQIDSLLDTQPTVEALFFPDSINRRRIMTQLMKAKKEVKVAMYYFTDQYYLNVLKTLSREDVKIKIIYTEMSDLQVRTTGTKLKVKKIPLRKVSAKYSNFMHHKFVIIDDSTVLTGSLNWTKMQHNENVIIIKHSEAVVQAFSQEFDNLYD